MTISVAVSPECAGEDVVRRSTLASGKLEDIPAPGVLTLYDVLQHSVQTRPEHHGMAYRTLEKMVEEEKEVIKMVDGVETKQKKTWKYFQLSPYSFLTYKEISTAANEIGMGLSHLGLLPQSKIEIFASTSAEWMLMAHGAFTRNMTIVTAYETLGQEGLLHSMNETGVDAIFTDASLLKTVAAVLPNCEKKPVVVYAGKADEEQVKHILSLTGKEVCSVEQLRETGREHPCDVVRPTSDDLCCVMYTSGSTGNPKGVMLKHSSLVGAIAGVNTLLKQHITSADTIMAYLPLAHVLEFLVENTCLFWGVTLGYGSARTLTEASVRNCKGDIKEFRPTLLTGVPAVWESIRKGVLNNVAKAGPTAQTLFHRSLTMKIWMQDRGLPTGWLDTLVFNKVKEQVGGRLRIGLSGGAPLAHETQQFLSAALAPILGGYGMTESCGMCTIMTPAHFSVGPVGGPVPCCEIKLVDVPDANYVSTNKPKPQGEIWVRGPSITTGYWNQPELTKETITKDGWLRTGDVGEWNEDGTLSVIDRIKNLVKLNNGEYIALEKLESVYKTALGVANICVYGDSHSPRPVALVVPVPSALKRFATEAGVDTSLSTEELCSHEAVRKAFLSQLLEEATKASLKPAEILANVHLCDSEWTSENGMLTAAQKLKRQNIQKEYQEQLEAMNVAQKA